jgi:hypothetical protein
MDIGALGGAVSPAVSNFAGLVNCWLINDRWRDASSLVVWHVLCTDIGACTRVSGDESLLLIVSVPSML